MKFIKNLINVEVKEINVAIGIDWLNVSLKNNRKKGIKIPDADAPAAFANIVTKNINTIPIIST